MSTVFYGFNHLIVPGTTRFGPDWLITRTTEREEGNRQRGGARPRTKQLQQHYAGNSIITGAASGVFSSGLDPGLTGPICVIGFLPAVDLVLVPPGV